MSYQFCLYQVRPSIGLITSTRVAQRTMVRNGSNDGPDPAFVEQKRAEMTALLLSSNSVNTFVILRIFAFFSTQNKTKTLITAVGARCNVAMRLAGAAWTRLEMKQTNKQRTKPSAAKKKSIRLLCFGVRKTRSID